MAIDTANLGIRQMPDLSYIKNRWFELTSKYCKDEELLLQFFTNIQNAYSEPQRFYHKLDHIEYMLKLSENYSVHLSDKDVVDLSIFYHDYVYIAVRGDNEEKSAQE